MKTKVAKPRRWRLWIMGSIALALIVMATVVGSASLMFPWLLSHPERVEQFLSERLQRPVRFDSISGEWRASGPRFALTGLRIGDAGSDAELGIERAELAVDFYAFLHRGRSWHELSIVAPEIDLQRLANGRWQVRQWQGARSGGRQFDLSALRSLGAVGLRGARVRLTDMEQGRHLQLVDVELRISPRTSGREVHASFRTDAGSVPLQLACHLAGDFADGRCYLRGRQLQAADWSSTWPIHGVSALQGRLDLDVWVDLAEFLPQRARVELVASETVWRGARLVQLDSGQTVEPRFGPERMELALQWQRLADSGWKLDILEADSLAAERALQAPTRLSLRSTGVHPERKLEVQIASLRLERVLPWLTLSDALSPIIAGTLYESAPTGELKGLSLVQHDDGRRALQGSLRDVGWNATRRLPRLSGLGGELQGDQGATVLRLDRIETELAFPGTLRAPVALKIAPMVLSLTPTDEGAVVAVEDLDLRGEGFGIKGQLALAFERGGGRPHVQAVIDVLPGEVTAAKAVWPINVMPAVTVRWLDRALLAGQIDHGRAVIRGDLDDWPFAGKEGVLDAVAWVSDTAVKFNPQWPEAHLESARVQFLDNSMQIDLPAASVAGNPVRAAVAHIANMRAPVLVIEALSRSHGRDLIELIRSSPLQSKFGAELLGVSVDGEADVDIRMQLPLGRQDEERVVEGRVTLRDADLRDLKWNLRFDKASGQIRFNGEGFSADALNVRMGEHVAELSIAVGDFVGDETHQLEASLRGELPFAAVAAGISALDGYHERFPGAAQWDIALLADRSSDGAPGRKRLQLSSDLRGMAIDLPAPMRKDAGTPMPLQVDLQLPLESGEIELKLGQLARFRGMAEGAERDFAGHLALGGGLADSAPEQGLKISGEVAAIDLGGWAALGHGGDGSLALDVDLRAEEVDVLGRAFSDTTVQIVRSAAGSRINLVGEGIDGGFDLSPAQRELPGITARFKTLHWPEADPRAPSKPMNPTLIPPLHIWVGDLRLGASGFGEARIETRPTATGMMIEELNTRSATLTMRASGSWELGANGEFSALDINFSAEDIGLMLQGLGYGSFIEGGQTVARLQGRWAGSPAQFGLARVVGTLEGEVGEGRILEVEPGAGRLFGLVNFGAIPRRLSLDFSDFFKSGMAFDSIKGSFRLDAGQAYTDDLKVKAPSAEIDIRGRAGLIARDYDQEMEVVPRVRSALPLVGAVAAGPVGAVVGVLAQDMLRKPLDGIVTARYRVQGSWDKPEVILISKEKRKPAEEDIPAGADAEAPSG